MASQGFQRATSIPIIIFSVLLMIALVHTQGVNAYDEDCGGCWADMDDIINNIIKEKQTDFSRHRGDSMMIGQGETAQQPRPRWFPHQLFRRSTSDSTSLECDACWVVLSRLKSRSRSSDDKEISSLGHLVKKAMLNNGWI